MSERIFGHILGIVEGHVFDNRFELSLAKVHRPLQAGISGSQNEGADSIVLSGGYEDDLDYGDVIVYTGHGGRDVNSGKQVTNQLLNRQNMALAKNCQLGLPVRLIRGFNHKSLYSPVSGYRYDGLFTVESYWKERGRSGFNVWRFRLIKQSESHSQFSIATEGEERYGPQIPKRKQIFVQRIIRDTEIGRRVKELYEYRCQVCSDRLTTNAGYYAEAAHIVPLGTPHNGPDIRSNVLCLCPNHHAMFDFGGFAIDDDFGLLGMVGKIFLQHEHSIDI